MRMRDYAISCRSLVIMVESPSWLAFLALVFLRFERRESFVCLATVSRQHPNHYLMPMHAADDDECDVAADAAGAVGISMVAGRSEGADESAGEGAVEQVTQKPFAELAELLKRRK